MIFFSFEQKNYRKMASPVRSLLLLSVFFEKANKITKIKTYAQQHLPNPNYT